MPISQIRPAGPAPEPKGIQPLSAEKPASRPFAKIVEELLGNVNVQQARADQGVRDLAVGKTDNVHNVMLEVAKADLNFRMILEIRNRLAEGFQEVLRLQV